MPPSLMEEDICTSFPENKCPGWNIHIFISDLKKNNNKILITPNTKASKK